RIVRTEQDFEERDDAADRGGWLGGGGWWLVAGGWWLVTARRLGKHSERGSHRLRAMAQDLRYSEAGPEPSATRGAAYALTRTLSGLTSFSVIAEPRGRRISLPRVDSTTAVPAPPPAAVPIAPPLFPP